MGELAKIACLDGGEWVQGLLASQKTGAALLWEWLPAAISAKRRIVELDPQERLGIRHKLNLGHTVGHVLETVHGLPHGLAVAQGLYFALSFSTQKGLLQATVKADLEARLRDRFGLYDRRSELPRIPQAQFVRLLAQDKNDRAGQKSALSFARDGTVRSASGDAVRADPGRDRNGLCGAPIMNSDRLPFSFSGTIPPSKSLLIRGLCSSLQNRR